MKNEDRNNVNFVFEDNAVMQQERVAKAYSRVVEEGRVVAIPAEVMLRYRWNVELTDVVKNYYNSKLAGKNVDVTINDNVVEIHFEKNGGKKAVSWRMSAEKAATFEFLEQLLAKSEYAYSEKNKTAIPSREELNEMSKRQLRNLYRRSPAYAPQYHYFVSGAKIDEVNIPIKIQIRDVNTVNGAETQYYTHNLIKIGDGASSDPNTAGTSRLVTPPPITII